MYLVQVSAGFEFPYIQSHLLHHLPLCACVGWQWGKEHEV